MRIAVPEHQGRVAPVFDTCTRIAIYVLSAGRNSLEASEDWSLTSRHGRALRLKELGVEMLLCGGISNSMEEQVRICGIQLVPWLAGEVPRILEAFREGTIDSPQFAMPGTRGCSGRTWGRRNCNSTKQKRFYTRRKEKRHAWLK
jgi:predicted Fe-Mo cluster-binding NifX family protein